MKEIERHAARIAQLTARRDAFLARAENEPNVAMFRWNVAEATRLTREIRKLKTGGK